MKITVLNKITFDDVMSRNNITDDNVIEVSDTFFISINDTTGAISAPHFKNGHQNVKIMFFDDTDIDIPTKGKKAFTIKQAEELIGFINDNIDKSNCIVHCSAGISRSGAVGTFINDFMGQNHFDFMRNNPMVKPNPHVKRTLMGVVRDKYSIE